MLARQYHYILFSLVLCVASIIALYDLGAKPLWDYDEATYAEITHELLQGDVVTLQYLHEPFLEKPPLYFWTAAITSTVFGESEFSLRLPAALSYIALIGVCMLILFEITGQMRAGILGGVILLTTSALLEPARQMRIDTMVVLWIMLAFYSLIRGLRQEKWFLLFGISVGLAVLTKSVIGVFALLALPVCAYWYSDYRVFKNIYVWWGIVAGLFVSVPWHAYEFWRFGHAFWLQYVQYSVTQRVAQDLFNMQAVSNKAYVWYLFNFAAPWAQLMALYVLPFFLFGKLMGVRIRNSIFISITMIAIIVLVFFAAATKAPTYLLPLYPFMAILLALGFWSVIKSVALTWQVLFSLLFGGLVLIGFFFTVYNGFHKNPYYGQVDQLSGEEKAVGKILNTSTTPWFAYGGYRELGAIIYYAGRTNPVRLTGNQMLQAGDTVVLYRSQKESFFREHRSVSTVALFEGQQIELLQIASEN